MHNPLSDNQFQKNTQAFADGELDPQTSLAMSQYLVSQPEKLQQIIMHQQMRIGIGKAMTKDMPKKAPADLLNAIQAIATTQANAPRLATSEPVIHTKTFNIPRQWVSIAALVMISVIALNVFKDRIYPNPLSVPNTYYIDYKVADSLFDQHNVCSRKKLTLSDEVKADKFSADKFSDEIRDFISKRIDTHININLDLTSANFLFERFGNCPKGGSGSQHLIYKAKEQPFYLSLWITPHKTNQASGNKQHLLPNTPIYTVTPFHDGSKRSIMAWKDEHATYYFVGDNHFSVERAADISLPNDKKPA